jgi:Rrf2 family protein
MNINLATDYGFRAVLYLSEQAQGEVVEAQAIAQSQSIPMRYLLKIMPSLIKAGIVRSQRGVGGGYALAKEPGEITLLDVIEAIEGPFYLNRCLIDESFCSKHGPPNCKVHQALEDIQQRLVQDFRSYTFAELKD